MHAHKHMQKARVSASSGSPPAGWAPGVGAAGWSLTSGWDLGQEQGGLRGLRGAYTPHKEVPQAPSCSGTVGLLWAGLGLRVATGCPALVLGISGFRVALSHATHSPRSREAGTVGVGAEEGGSAASQAREQGREDETGPEGASGAPQPAGCMAPAHIPDTGVPGRTASYHVATGWAPGHLVSPIQWLGLCSAPSSPFPAHLASP